MRPPIVRDLNETHTVDVVRAQLEMGLRAAESTLDEIERRSADADDTKRDKLAEQSKELEESIAKIKADLESYSSNDWPKLDIRIIPPSWMSSFQADRMRAGVKRLPDIDPEAEIRDLEPETRGALADLTEMNADAHRDLVRWGVVGWECMRGPSGADLPFYSDKAVHKGREYAVAAWDMVDIIELSGMLDVVADAVWRFNVLTEEDRKKS